MPSSHDSTAAAADIFGLDVEQYRPVEPVSHYGQFVVSHTGSYAPTPPLPARIAAFVGELHGDVGMWDGTLGTLGRDYVTHRPAHTRISAAQLDEYRVRYQQLVADTTPRAVLEQLRRTIEKQTRKQGQLRQAVQDVERRMEKLRRQRDKLEIDQGPSSERVQDLDDRLNYDGDELKTLRSATDQIQQRVLQTETELSERETGHVRRIALLRRIFGEEPLRGGLVLRYSSDAENKASAVNRCDQVAMRTSRLLLAAKCFYLDAVVAKTYLYKLETTLRSMLENLQHAVNSLNPPALNHHNGHRHGSHHHAHSSTAPSFRLRSWSGALSSPVMEKRKSGHGVCTVGSGSGEDGKGSGGLSGWGGGGGGQMEGVMLHRRLSELGPDFRLRYVRKLWQSLDGEYRAALRYIEQTSLWVAAERARQQGIHRTDSTNSTSGDVQNQNQNQNQHQNQHGRHNNAALTQKYGSFGLFETQQSAPILPRFSTMELSHALNKRAKVCALHRCAARVYKQVNVVYDVHEEVTGRALTLLQKRMGEDRKANEQLIAKWEDLLGVTDGDNFEM